MSKGGDKDYKGGDPPSGRDAERKRPEADDMPTWTYPEESNNPPSSRYPLRGTLGYYKNPTAPVGEDDWDALK